MDLSSYRAQQTAIDLVHQALIIMVFLIMVWLTVKAELANNPKLLILVPLLTVTILGLIMRLDTMVQRMGGFMKKMGDPWELAKATHKPTTYLMPAADVLVMVPIMAMLIYAEYKIWQQFKDSPRLQWGYLLGTLVLIAGGIGGWILAAIKAKTGF
jgi:hypothetical protein